MAKIFEVYRRAEPSMRSVKNYCHTYEFFLNGTLQHSLQYFSKYGVVEPANLQSNSDDTCLSLRPIKKMGGVQVDFLLVDRLLYSYKGHKLYDSEQRVVALVLDPTSFTKALFRNMLHGDPGTYIVSSPDKSTVYAQINDHKSKSRWPWPLTIIEAILKLLRSAQSAPRFTISIKTDAINTESLLVLSALLDAEKGRGV